MGGVCRRTRDAGGLGRAHSGRGVLYSQLKRRIEQSRSWILLKVATFPLVVEHRGDITSVYIGPTYTP